MTGLVRKAALLSAVALFGASAAMAGVASPGNCTVPGCIEMVGNLAGVADPGFPFTVIVRDLANTPLVGASVVLDFSGCTDIGMCSDQLDINATQVCGAKTTRRFTDGFGSVTFLVLGGGNAAPVTLGGGGRVYANGVLIASPSVGAFDGDGANGVGANDLSVWLTGFGTGFPFGMLDYDCSGGVRANDLSVWLTQFGAGTSAASCAAGQTCL